MGESGASSTQDREIAVHKRDLSGIGYAFLAFSAWGLLPLYWKLLEQVPALEVLAHRILWSSLFTWIALFLSGNWKQLKRASSSKRDLVLLALSGLLISGNWVTFIWAIHSGQVIETSLGYYINPLMVVFLGIFVFKERLNTWQYLSLSLAFIGVTIMTVQYGRIPWIALILASTFALYGLLKKTIEIDSTIGFALETFFVMPFALIYILVKEFQGTSSLVAISLSVTCFLVGTGVITAIPLIWFAKGARRVKFTTIGFLQYLAPTITLYLGIFIFNEPFTSMHMLSFGFIWVALLLYSLSLRVPSTTLTG